MLGEIINLLENIMGCFTSNVTLLQYLEKQPIEETIQFLGTSLKLCGMYVRLCFKCATMFKIRNYCGCRRFGPLYVHISTAVYIGYNLTDS